MKIIRSVSPASRPYDLRFMTSDCRVVLVVPLALNAARQQRGAADRCVVAGTHAGGAAGFVVARPHHSVLEHVTLSAKPCATTVWVDPSGGPLHR